MVFNGRGTIERCLDRLSFCDEIVVVDDGSTDGTWEFLQSREDIIAVQHAHTTFVAQREYAKDLTQGRWLLTMDADEYVTSELARAIQKAIVAPGAPDGFHIRRRNPFPRGLRGYEWSRHPRLVQRKVCRWQNTESPHSPLDCRGLRFKVLRGGHLEHEAIENYATALRKVVNRSLIMAALLRKQGSRAGIFRLAFSTLTRFFKIYFLRGVFRFGRSGVMVAFLAAFEAYCKYAFLLTSGSESLFGSMDGGPGSYPADSKENQPVLDKPRSNH